MWWKKVVFGKFFLAAVINSGLSVIAILFLRTFLPPVVPLFYGRPDGAAQLTGPLWLLIVPGLSLIITAVNLLLNILSKDTFLKKILAFSTLIISIISLITIVKIGLLVGFF